MPEFFYPLVKEKYLPALLEVLKLDDEAIEDYAFEKMIDHVEKTNFDFYIRLESGKQLFFEIKFTEDGFKKESPHEKYKEKYENVYKERLAEKLKPELDEYETLMKNYQLVRNISYVDASGQNILIIIYPEGNRKIRKEYDNVMDNVIERNFHPHIRLLTWEDVCTDLMEVLQDSNASARLLNQYSDFAGKYLPLEGED